MPGQTALYSTDIAPTITPWASAPQPATLIRWDNDLDESSYTPPVMSRRGSVIQTGGGNVVHDMGAVASDARITASGTVAGGTWITTATATAILTAYNSGGEYYFSDGARVWKVLFLPGPDVAPQMSMSLNWQMSSGVEVWSWSVTLMVLAEVTP